MSTHSSVPWPRRTVLSNGSAVERSVMVGMRAPSILGSLCLCHTMEHSTGFQFFHLLLGVSEIGLENVSVVLTQRGRLKLQHARELGNRRGKPGSCNSPVFTPRSHRPP